MEGGGTPFAPISGAHAPTRPSGGAKAESCLGSPDGFAENILNINSTENLYRSIKIGALAAPCVYVYEIRIVLNYAAPVYFVGAQYLIRSIRADNPRDAPHQDATHNLNKSAY